jgi:molybdate transport system permease protein
MIVPVHSHTWRIKVVYGIGSLFLFWFLFIFLYQYIAALSRSSEVFRSFRDHRILYALLISLASACVTAGIAIIFGVPLAYFFATKKFPFKTIIENLAIDVPQTFPPVAEGIILLLMIGPDSVFHINLAYTFSALVIAKLFVAAPFVVALTLRKFLEIHLSGLDVIARSLGADQFQVFRTIFLPLAFKDMMAGVALCWARAMGELGGSMIFAGIIPFKTEIIPTFIAEHSSDIGSALAATIMVTTASIIALIFFKLIAPGSALWKALFYKP